MLTRARRAWSAVALLTLAVATPAAVIALGLQGHKPFTDVFLGLVWGVVPTGWAVGAVCFWAPDWMIRWRQSAIDPKPNWRSAIEEWFARRLAINREAAGQSRKSHYRVRRLGMLLMWFWAIVVLVLLTAPPFTDKL